MMIPDHAKPVFQGKFHTVYQWQQEMFDGSYKLFEAVKRIPCVHVIALVGKRLMILEQQQPGRAQYPSLPGGWIEDGEEELDALRRELLEETGYTCDETELCDESFGTSKYQFHDRIYIARGCRKVAEQHMDGGEKIEVLLVSFEDFLQYCRNEDFAISVNLRMKMYEALLDQQKKELFHKQIFNL